MEILDTAKTYGMRPSALAQRWGLSVGTLANQRLRGEGPAYIKMGNAVVYLISDIEAFEEAHRVGPVAA